MGTENFLYEDDSELIIPTDGQYIRIYHQNNGTTTVLDTGEKQFVLNGRSMRMEHYSSLEGMAGLIVQEPSELHSAFSSKQRMLDRQPLRRNESQTLCAY